MFAELLAHPDGEEVCELRGPFGFMAYHGGGLEVMTDVIARSAAERSGASYYGVHQPQGMDNHIPSIEVSPDASPALARFIDHVEVVITVHGFGRAGFFTSLLVGGQNRDLAAHLSQRLSAHLPAYDVVADLEAIPVELRGTHPRNPVNLPRQAGVQLELPPRVRGSSPLWWDWEGPDLTPHTQSLVTALAETATSWAIATDVAG